MKPPIITLTSPRKSNAWFVFVGVTLCAILFAALKASDISSRISAPSSPQVQLTVTRASQNKIYGEAVNLSGRKIDIARVEFALYDGDAKVGDARDRVSQWQAGEKWKFEAPSFHRYTHYTIQRVICDGMEVSFKEELP